MSSGEGYSRPSIDREDLTDDQEDNPPPYDQVVPPFEGQSGKPGLLVQNNLAVDRTRIVFMYSPLIAKSEVRDLT